MCPDKKLLSVYFDNELPSPWKEKLEIHLDSCPECKKTIENYRRFGASIRGADAPLAGLETAQARVWEKLSGVRGFDESEKTGQNEETIFFRREHEAFGKRPLDRFTKASFWRRSIKVPLPFAAAAAALFAAVLLFQPAQSGKQQILPVAVNLPPTSALTEEREVSAVSPAAGIEQIDPFDFEVPASAGGQISGMNSIFKLLEDDDSNNVIIIKLPEKRQYNSSGKPAIIRAVDYAKRAEN
ncbi:MAG: zf-HC2 domain-containing protein [Spirochaetaceae bacterium]|jgi:hypothetical protein|nr:zf-HC2 domain-containing protein [Spirochaetaceae bacterium]